MISRAALARLQPLTPVSVLAGELAALMDRAERSTDPPQPKRYYLCGLCNRVHDADRLAEK